MPKPHPYHALATPTLSANARRGPPPPPPQAHSLRYAPGPMSNRTVALPDVNQNVASGERNGEVDNGLECRHHLIIIFIFYCCYWDAS